MPKAIRDRLGLSPGAGIELVVRASELVLTPIGHQITVQERGGRGVFVLESDDGAALTDDDVRQLVDESRQWPRA